MLRQELGMGGPPMVYRWSTGACLVSRSIAREQWDSSLMACLVRNEEFCCSDPEVCKPAIVPSTPHRVIVF
ncbi:hypothetical protein SLA2020_508260 [Shorea laevis]